MFYFTYVVKHYYEHTKVLEHEKVQFYSYNTACENKQSSIHETVFCIIYINVSWIMVFLACWYKISLILSKKLMGFKEITVLCELT